MDFDFVYGSGRLVFFLHGWGGDKNSFSFVKNYINFQNKNMVFVSFSGFGASPPPYRAYSVLDYAEEIKELIAKLAKGKSVDIVCHSFGGRVATILSAKYPQLVNSMFFVDVAGVRPRRSLKYYIKVRKYKRLKKLVKLGKKDKGVLSKYGSEDYKALDGVMKETFVKVVNQDLTAFYKNIKCPVFLFWGKDDKDTPLYMAKKMKKRIRNSKLFVVKNAGHFSYLDNPALFLGCLDEFLTKNNQNI